MCVTSAVLLDTFLNTFSRSQMLDELGFFYYIIAGVIVGGMAVWTWGVLKPVRETTAVAPTAVPSPQPPAMPVGTTTAVIPPPPPLNITFDDGTAFDRQMLYNEIRTRFGHEDVLDLMFDLGINENDVATLDQNVNQLIVNIMDTAQQNGQTSALTLAVERILTPISPHLLPRPEKITVASPPTILRYYLLATYSLTDLREIAAQLGIDWEQIGGDNKKAKVRNFLLYLYRRNRIDELIDRMHASTESEEEE
ncbi:MAG: hypothetical protein KBE23_13400 [Chloroflexi bacterium]|nr:hypothetical protein [Chloroflexota bacterium]MBP7043734.1 hypothetical protein [Chloroflexota bacterium]